ncbi:hypothetical protein GN958_ATG20347 [Phytophthora infestans]|uniref:Uncharacterized protein n=1 Tax=Phytophthora infestans TaxID=4787 RepID=A0A8S9TR41_PHYIN|nr:hypothetical protein GN958_ATG20347 [Phytophthora infestans]
MHTKRQPLKLQSSTDVYVHIARSGLLANIWTLGGFAVHIFGMDYIIKAASASDSMYYVHLTNTPSDLDDE